jgi:hypothetical protein
MGRFDLSKALAVTIEELSDLGAYMAGHLAFFLGHVQQEGK